MFPEMFSNPWMEGWNSFLQMQRRWTENLFGMMGKSPGPAFQNPAMGFFQTWFEMYEKEFRTFLKIPPLGLTRFHQERCREAMDKYSQFQHKIMVFLYSLLKPIENSFSGAQEKLAELMEQGEISQDPKEYYRIWIKTLEGYYLSFLRSGEYMESMNEVLQALEDFLLARQKVFQMCLQMLSIPTNGDLDDLAKEFYTLKKRLKEAEKKIENRRPDASAQVQESVAPFAGVPLSGEERGLEGGGHV
jgi:polyhydroxyalkanoate synthase subunit PhaE